ncbi:hypothetical protein COCSUDRAFT_62333 [Coccomyxa subellipsoidea C-169]|uniref:Uncharacterized protein n=1 Tax=Coccomyxa subellipsoidea (strain C-169) TaxID=574566 RepID=I0Z2Q4_COCSC|nr:hypothetical protein COCSUDRAFT_62333 [Coccomyxa subellipsoidea C-169]EIE24923.1 hypothetical protein COCSUDRAFT_62333 [Coccomyxa subellipsoidea C-169]|eukprot:XP_005649467.1 hypothetical protein COCSUDRAFT_62333 [Coccomyxa subellipsoidea C-169]
MKQALCEQNCELQQLQAALSAESEARRSAEEALERVTLERQRLQRARDELATNLLAAQQRAQEAEEDQQRAEEQTAAAIAEVDALQARLSANGAEISHASDAAPAGDGADTSRELELERSRNAVLVAALSSAKGGRERAEREAAAARQRMQQLEQQLQMAHSAGPPPPSLPGPASAYNGPASMAKSVLSQETATDPESMARQITALKRQVTQLKASRDKLLAELDIQFVEADRMGNENNALSQALQEVREAGAAWERQAQEAAAQLERLKDLLEESALWRREQPPRPEASPPNPPGENGTASSGERNGTEAEDRAASDSQYIQAHILDLEQRFMQESAKSAALDLQVRALCAELNRAAQATGSLGRSVLPALNGIESRLSQALHLTAGR